MIVAGMMMLTCGAMSLAQENLGGQPGAFLRIPTGTRPVGMGSAFTAVAEGGDAMYWNIAGLSQGNEVSLSSSYSILDYGRQHISGALAIPAKVLSFGLHWNRYVVDDIQGRDASGGTTHTFNSTESSYGAGLSLKLGPLALGGGAKYYQQMLDDYSSKGVGYDAGVMLTLVNSSRVSFRMGAALTDYQGEVEWNTPAATIEIFPETARYGVSLGIKGENISLLVASDYCRTNFEDEILCFGLELGLFDTLVLRGGLRDDMQHLGASINLGSFGFDFATSEGIIQEKDYFTVGVRLNF